jgi:cytochrome c553
MLRLALIVPAAVVAFAPCAGAETALERGTYLMTSIAACGNCHTQQTPNGPMPGMELAGGQKVEEDFGAAFAANITPDPETGIGKWTDAQIITAIREGKRPDGSIIGPPMPIALYRSMADDDVKAIVAYLRQVNPVVNKVEKSQYKIPLPPAYGPPVTSVQAPPRSDKVAYGGYLAGPIAHCLECHSTPGPRGPDFVNHPGAGGLAFHGPWGVSHGANITPTGIGKWSDADIKKAITTGVRPDGVHLKPPMGFYYYKNMAEADLDAIVAFLRTLKPL